MKESDDSQEKSSTASTSTVESRQDGKVIKLLNHSRRFLQTPSKPLSIPEPVSRYRLGAYVRLSPSDEVRDEGSLVSHPQRIRSHVDYKCIQQPGWGEIVEWYTDKDMSGKDMNRPAFLRMLQDIQLGRINAVIVTELSRLSRDVKDFGQFWEFLKKHDASFFSLKENFDTSTPIGEMMVYQCISFAQFERKTIVQRIKDGARARAERGLAGGGQRMLGYDPHPEKRCHLAVNEVEAGLIRHIFEKFIELRTIASLQNYLNSSGYRTKSYVTKKDGRQKGGKVWSNTSLYALLTNLAYIGKREINKVNRGKTDAAISELDRYRLVEASWPAIISAEVFERVQEILVSNRKFAKPHTHTYRLTGFVHCGVCGELVCGQSANGKSGKFFYYAHNRKFRTTDEHHLHRCTMERIPAAKLEEAVIARLRQLSRDPKLLAQIVADSQARNQGVEANTDQLIASKEQDRRKVQQMLDNLIRTLAENPEMATSKAILDKIKALETQAEQIKTSIDDLKLEKRNKDRNVIHAEYVFRLFRLFKEGFETLSAQKQRDILKEVVYRITIEEGCVKLFYYGSPKAEEILLDLSPNSDSSGSSLNTARPGVRVASKEVEVSGFEPLAFALRTRRSTN